VTGRLQAIPSLLNRIRIEGTERTMRASVLPKPSAPRPQPITLEITAAFELERDDAGHQLLIDNENPGVPAWGLLVG
jgi:hypothetical protein